MAESATVRLAVCGLGGRMGRLAADLAAEADDIRLVGGIGRAAGAGPGETPVVPADRAGEIIAQCDVLLDVSAPAALAAVLDAADRQLEHRALVVGTTGLTPDQEARLDGIARSTAVLVASNFSIGVNLLEALVARAAAALPAAAFDVEIVETHHAGKQDAPSGTALTLGRAAATARGDSLDAVRIDGRSGRTDPRPTGQIGFHAMRGGAVPGEHRVHFLGRLERLELAHQAMDRAVFAEGALAAVRWIAGRGPGRYHMRDVLGL